MLRGIKTLSDEQKKKRKERRLFLILGRVIGIVLILAAIAGQMWINQRSWKSYAEGRTFDSMENFQSFVETEVKSESAETDEIWLSSRENSETYVVTDGYGNVILEAVHRNQSVTDFDVVYDENGQNVVSLVTYTAEDEEAGRWKKELVNLFFFTLYPLITIVCGLFSGRANRNKQKRKAQTAEEDMESDLYDDEYDDDYDE